MDATGAGLDVFDGALEVFEGTAEAFNASVEVFNDAVRVFAAAGTETASELLCAFCFGGVGGMTSSSSLSSAWDLLRWALTSVDICSISSLRPLYLTVIFKLVL